MLKILKPAETRAEYAYRRIFQADYECRGFLCDENGSPIFRNPREKIQFEKCIEKPHIYKDCGRVRREFTHCSPAIARCECGNTLKLRAIWGKEHISCRCGKTYGLDGTEVPRIETC